MERASMDDPWIIDGNRGYRGASMDINKESIVIYCHLWIIHGYPLINQENQWMTQTEGKGRGVRGCQHIGMASLVCLHFPIFSGRVQGNSSEIRGQSMTIFTRMSEETDIGLRFCWSILNRSRSHLGPLPHSFQSIRGTPSRHEGFGRHGKCHVASLSKWLSMLLQAPVC